LLWISARLTYSILKERDSRLSIRMPSKKKMAIEAIPYVMLIGAFIVNPLAVIKVASVVIPVGLSVAAAIIITRNIARAKAQRPVRILTAEEDKVTRRSFIVGGLALSGAAVALKAGVSSFKDEREEVVKFGGDLWNNTNGKVSSIVEKIANLGNSKRLDIIRLFVHMLPESERNQFNGGRTELFRLMVRKDEAASEEAKNKFQDEIDDKTKEISTRLVKTLLAARSSITNADIFKTIMAISDTQTAEYIDELRKQGFKVKKSKRFQYSNDPEFLKKTSHRQIKRKGTRR